MRSKKWSADEYIALYHNVKSGKSYEEIASINIRNVGLGTIRDRYLRLKKYIETNKTWKRTRPTKEMKKAARIIRNNNIVKEKPKTLETRNIPNEQYIENLVNEFIKSLTNAIVDIAQKQVQSDYNQLKEELKELKQFKEKAQKSNFGNFLQNRMSSFKLK